MAIKAIRCGLTIGFNRNSYAWVQRFVPLMTFTLVDVDADDIVDADGDTFTVTVI